MLVGPQKMGYRTHRASWTSKNGVYIVLVGPQKGEYWTHRTSWPSKKGNIGHIVLLGPQKRWHRGNFISVHRSFATTLSDLDEIRFVGSPGGHM